MSRINWVLMVVVACVSGMVGAVLTARVPVLVRARGLGVAEVVRAGRFEVVDSSGKVRVELGRLKDEVPMLRLRDKAGKVRVLVSTQSDGSPALMMMDKAGEARVVLSMLLDDLPSLTLCDEAGTRRIGLSVVYNPMLTLCDKAGNSCAALYALGSGTSVLTMHDKTVKRGVLLSAGSAGGPSLDMDDKGGAASLQVKPDGLPELTLSDKHGKTIWSAPK